MQEHQFSISLNSEGVRSSEEYVAAAAMQNDTRIMPKAPATFTD
jgi:hypothetical protein